MQNIKNLFLIIVRPELYESGDWFLLHDNTPSCNTTLIHKFLAKKEGDCPSPSSLPPPPQLGSSRLFFVHQTQK